MIEEVYVGRHAGVGKTPECTAGNLSHSPPTQKTVAVLLIDEENSVDADANCKLGEICVMHCDGNSSTLQKRRSLTQCRPGRGRMLVTRHERRWRPAT